ncbi:MAG TPA: hypothetical protein P5181_13000 [Dermatophilaceae bacterium]|nr:hypothetical protein [Dermatophilaceae bacterium]
MSTGRRVLGLGAATIAAGAVTSVLLAPVSGGELVRLQVSFDPAYLAGQLAEWERTGALGSFTRHFAGDVVLIAAYAAWLPMLLRYLAARQGRRVGPGVARLPLVAAVADLVEDAAQLRLVAERPDVSTPLVVAGAGAACIKWGMLLATLASALWVIRPRAAASDSPR